MPKLNIDIHIFGGFMIKKCIILLGFLIAAKNHAANIVFDSGDVIFETKYAQTLWNIGPLKLLHYASTGNNPFAAHKKLFTFLDAIKPYNPDQNIIKDAHGHHLPQLMIDWLKGQISGTEILEMVRHTPGNFANTAEESLVRALAEVIFNPEYFVQTRQAIPQAVSLIKSCKKAGHAVYLLSNWDAESFDLLKQEYPEVFDLFDGLIVSGKIGMVKPDDNIYHYLLETYQLDPYDTILIDDQPENIAAAERNGIHGIHYTKSYGFFGAYHDFCHVRHAINAYLMSKDLSVAINNDRQAHHCHE